MSFTKEQADALIASFNSISTEAQAIQVIEQMKEVLLETDTLDGSKAAMCHLAKHLTDGLTDSPYKALFAPIMRLIQIHQVKDVNAQDKKGRTLLYWALKHGDKSSIDLLMLKYGADIDAPQNEDGDTLLHLAVKANDLPMVVRLLNEYGAKVDARDKQGNTALHHAVATGNLKIVKFLVKQKAEVNAKNILGATPLHFITEKTSIEMVEFLVKKGVEVNAKDNENYMPIHRAAQYWQVNAFEKLIKKYKVDTHAVTTNGASVLHNAAANPKPDVARFLIGRCGIAADVQDKYGDNALYFAAGSNSIDTFKYFMQEIGKKGKVDINRPGQDQLTLLHRAARYDCLDIIKYLLEEKATVDPKDKYGNTPLHQAVSFNSFKVVQHFVEVLKINVNVPTKEGIHPLHVAGRVKDIRIAQCLVEGGANIYAKTQSGGLPWHWAATKENFVVLEYLIEEAQKKDGFDIDSLTGSQRTALHWAAQGGRLEVVNFLHLRKAKLEAKDENGDMALHLAAEAGKCSVVEYFVNDCKMDINTRDGCGDSLLHLAVKSGDMETVEFLVQNAKQNKKFDVEVLGFHKKTPLHLAAEMGHLDLVKFFLEQEDAELNAKDEDNFTALHWAARNGHLGIVKYLIEEHRADITAFSRLGNSALSLAIQYNHADVVKYLMEEHKADIDPARSKNNQTALHLAAADGSLSVVKYLVNECKVDINAKDKLGNAPWIYAARKSHVEVVKFLIEQKNRNLGPEDPLEICTWAAIHGHLSIMECLVKEQKINVNVKDHYRLAPLHIAAVHGQVEVMRYLIDQKADINAQAIDDGTPLYHARIKDRVEAVRLLLKAGVDTNAGDTHESDSESDSDGDEIERIPSEIDNLIKDSSPDKDRAKKIYEQIFSIRASSEASSVLVDMTIPPLRNIVVGYVASVEFESKIHGDEKVDLHKKIIVLAEEALMEFAEKMDDPALVSQIETAVNIIISLLKSEHYKAESRIYWSELKKEFKRIRQGKNISKSFMKVALAKIVPPSKLPSGPLASLESMLSILSVPGQNPVSSVIKSEEEREIKHAVVPMEVDDDVAQAVAMSLETPLPMDCSDSNVDIKTMRVVETKSEKKEEQLPLPMSYPSSSSSFSSMSMGMEAGKVELKHEVPQLQRPSVVLQTVKQEDSRMPDAKTEPAWVSKSANTHYGSNWWWKAEPIVKAESTAPESLKRKRESQEEGVNEEKGQGKRGRVVKNGQVKKEEHYGTTSTVGIFSQSYSKKSHDRTPCLQNTRVGRSRKPNRVQVKKEPVVNVEL